jgi:hypothetical protein
MNNKNKNNAKRKAWDWVKSSVRKSINNWEEFNDQAYVNKYRIELLKWEISQAKKEIAIIYLDGNWEAHHRESGKLK